MHPVLHVPELQGLEKSIYDTLARSGANGLSQIKVIKLLDLTIAKKSSVSRSLRKLISWGLVEKSGATKDASFKLTVEAQWFSMPRHLRPAIPYDPKRIDCYDPTTKPWLEAGARTLMSEYVGQRISDLDASTYTREIAERFLTEMSWASSSLEGNSYSLSETEALIKYADTATGKSATEAQMILNHKHAINWLIDNIATVELSPETVMKLQAMLMRSLVRQDSLGSIRKEPVAIPTSSYIPSADRTELMTGLSELCQKAANATDPFEASFALLAGIAYICPFIDGNMLTARLACNIPLLKAGFPPISFVGVDRTEYDLSMPTWYELGEPKYLSKSISEGYLLVVSSYSVSSPRKRVPLYVEVRTRQQLDKALARFLAAAVEEPSFSPEDFVASEFEDLSREELEIITRVFNDVIEKINEVNCVAYGIDPETAKRYLAARLHPHGTAS